jgi:hypothetical protein
MRDTKSFVDGLKYSIPGQREALLPKRDWSGQPLPNPGYATIVRMREVDTDPVDIEMARLGIHPAPPVDRISSVKLPPHMYDEYQVAAGALTRQMLENLVKQPGWYNMPAFAREEVFKKMISASRQQAAATIQMRYPQIMQQAISDKIGHIEGNKPTKLKEP